MPYASNTVRDALNRANSSTIATHLQKVQLGTVVAGHVPQQISGAVPAAQTNELGTVLGLGLPYTSRASAVLRATVRSVGSGSVLGELTPVKHDVTPSTGEVAVSPSGDVVFLASDAATKVDVVYAPVAGEVVELTAPCPLGIMALPAWIVARNPLLLLEATADVATIGGRKIILAPAAAVVVTTKAALAIDRSKVYFNYATDVVTYATVKLLLTPETPLVTALAAQATTA